MKSLLCLVAGLALVITASADPYRYQWRALGGVNVDLQPLFSWWALTSQSTNGALDLTIVDTNKLAQASNLWTHLPPRPLPEWCRIRASEDRIMVAGSLWKVEALLEPAPMMTKYLTIYVQNPPTKEIQDYKQARAILTGLQNGQKIDAATEQYFETNIQAEMSVLHDTNSPVYAAPGTAEASYAAAALQRDSLAAASNLNDAHARTQTRDAQSTSVERFLSVFPDKNVYWFDHFGVRTGKIVDGHEVYDLGIAPGLTY